MNDQFLSLMWLLGGLVALVLGGDLLVRGAAALARQLGISALVVGLTVVAFGTSAPEVAVTLSAGAQHQDDIAVANVVGSCIMNILVVLAFAALARPLAVSRSVTYVDGPIMAATLIAFMGLLWTYHELLRWMGWVFLGGLAIYTVAKYFAPRHRPEDVIEEVREYEKAARKRGPWVNPLLVIIGIVMLVYGARGMVYGAVGIAEWFGVSQRFIGLTIVALGTSLPELATCVIASRKGHADLAVGNVVGSNIFNILAVLGVTVSIYPLSVAPTTLWLDGPVMLAAGILVLPVLRSGHTVTRREGAVMLLIYIIYFGWTLIADTPPDSAATGA